MESEQALVRMSVDAISAANWQVGRCAALWVERCGRCRDNREFAVIIGMTTEEVWRRRRVYETFWMVRDDYPNLKWLHFLAALEWDDACRCLSWANEWDATVAEMRAWRRAQRGDDLTGG